MALLHRVTGYRGPVTHEGLGPVLVARPRYTREEYLSLTRNHQTTYHHVQCGWNCSGSADFVHEPLDFRRSRQASTYPPSTRNASGVPARDVPAGRNTLSQRGSNFLRHPQHPQEVQTLTGHRSPNEVGVAPTRCHTQRTTVRLLFVQRTLEFVRGRWAGGSSNSADVDRCPSWRPGFRERKKRSFPVANSGSIIPFCQCRGSATRPSFQYSYYGM